MATPPEQPWSNHEKNYLLAEIIKASNPPANVLYGVIQNLQLQPRWDDTPLPPGRSLNACRYTFEDLRRSLATPLAAAIGSLTPTPMSGPMPTLKRPFPYEATYSGGHSGREIRPKPSLTSSIHTQPSPTDPPTKKKRGRPTKAEALAKAEAAAASVPTFGEPPPVTMPRPLSQSTPQPPLLPQATFMVVPSLQAEEYKAGPAPNVPPVTRMPIAAMLTPTTREPHKGSQSHSGSSSGRRRRARSTKSEPGESPVRHSVDAGNNYESPYARPDAPDTPARAAVLRHREVPSHEPKSHSTHDSAPKPSDRKLLQDQEQH